MASTFVISYSRETGNHQLWAWNRDDADNRLTPIEASPVIDALGSGYTFTVVGSYILFYKLPATFVPGGDNFIDYTLVRVDITGSGVQLSVVQQASWYWDKFTGGYSYTNNPGGPQVTDLNLIGVTGYVMSRIQTAGRNAYAVWNFDAYNDAPGGTVDPIHDSMSDPDAFPTIDDGEVLIPYGNYVFALNFETRAWRKFSFDPQLPNPLSDPPVANGTLPADMHGTVVAVGDELVAWTPGETGHAIYDGSADDPFSNPRMGAFPDEFAADSATAVAALHPPVRAAADAQATPGTIEFMQSKIKHVVYYVLESRSFDSVVGWLYDQTSDIHWVGAPTGSTFEGASETNDNESADGTKYYQNKYKGGDVGTGFNLDSPQLDPFHGTPDAIDQQWKGGYASYTAKDDADMGGFVLNNGNAQVMETYSPAQLAILNTLAKSYAVSDEWFSSEAGGTTTNRATMASGSAYDITTSYEGGDAYEYFSKRPRRQSMWKVLANNGIMDWAIYYSILWENLPYTYHLFLEGQLPSVDEYSGQYSQPIASFLDAARNGTLPAFSFLEPVWVDPSGLFTSYHPAGDVLPGEQALQNIFDALTSNADKWNETALVISFSKGGGMYDHVPSRFMHKAWHNDGNDGYEFDTTGTRVPTLVISPWVTENTVFRSGKDTPFDATSLAATVLSWLGIPRWRWGMGERIAHAPTFEQVFDRSSARTNLPSLTRAVDKTYPTTDPIPVAAPAPVSSTWGSSGGSGAWTDKNSWSGGVIPTDVATFAASINTTVTFAFTDPQTVNEVKFIAEAPAYTLLLDEEKPATPTLTIAGKGVSNQSVNTQTFKVQASSVSTAQIQLAFLNSACAGGANVTYKVAPTTPDSQSGGIIAFNQRSSAGSARFVVSVGARPPGPYSTVGAEVRFLHRSTADKASFVVSGTTGVDTDTFGNVVFHNYATAASASFFNVGGTVGDGGNTQFYEQASADGATIVNQGATGCNGNGGDTAFDGTATAGNATITNEAASAGHGGVTSFNNNAPRMAATFGATAGNATIVNKGGEVGQTGTGGHTELTGIYGAGSGGTATIDNYGSATSEHESGGYTLFAVNGKWPYARPTADEATITNHPSTAKGAVPGTTTFTYQNWDGDGDKSKPGPTAGSATITNKGATVSGALGGTTTFDYHATAGNATLTAEGGTNGGGPGIIYFQGEADGGTAAVDLKGGTLDVTGSWRNTISLATLTVHTGGTMAYQVGGDTPIVSVTNSFTLGDGVTASFAFTLEDGKSIPTREVTLLEAASLANMSHGQFTGTLAGATCAFTIDKSASPPRLKVRFTPNSGD